MGKVYQQSMIQPEALELTKTPTIARKIQKDHPSIWVWLEQLLSNQLICLFTIILIGLAFGSLSWGGVSFGSAGILFVALIFGHFNFSIPAGVGSLGLVLFIYCMGLAAGSSFFSVLASQGIKLVKLSILTLCVAMLVSYALAIIFDIRVDLMMGLFAGALTSTPALAAALDLLKEGGSLVTVGYGIAYPFGVIGVVLFVQLLPRILKIDLNKEAELAKSTDSSESIVRVVVSVENARLVGEPIKAHKGFEELSAQISRKIEGDEYLPIAKDTFELGMKLVLVTIRKHIPLIEHLIGPAVN